ncbi:MAG TPA: hypothetical protein ENN79_11700 [Desulfobacteraceae bacterium]|nr:hypothetical protein [Desulfobacteraceae bacterium]
MDKAAGFIEVDMFSSDVDDESHPEAAAFKELLEDVASEYDCTLCSFEVSSGTAVFSFDSEELTAEILKLLQQDENDES